MEGPVSRGSDMIRELSEHEIDALHYELLVKDIIATAEKLPPFPDIAWKVSHLARTMAPVQEIEEIVKYDQAITAKILRLGNSAYYGRQYEIRSVKDAILLLGSKRLIQAVLTACASRYFSGPNSGEDRVLWEHSVTSALLSEIVARRFDRVGALALYTAALLHDIGSTIVSVYFKVYRQLHLRRSWGECDTVSAERRTLGIDHQELGGIITRNWKFPSEISAAIEHHHNPEKAGLYSEITSLVYLADRMAESFEESAKPESKKIDPEADPIFKKLGITQKMILDFKSELGTGVKGILETLGPE
jgi:putative nucleotidyltransferase with HDIG domain